VAAPPPSTLTSAERGLAFAQARCSGCHEITATGISPNPASPPFAAVVNKPGITRDTLRQFLRDSHNFPDAMNFRVEPEQIDDLADYMLTLQTPDYHPPI
jgi:mono/diheme cytochrome c family protein